MLWLIAKVTPFNTRLSKSGVRQRLQHINTSSRSVIIEWTHINQEGLSFVEIGTTKPPPLSDHLGQRLKKNLPAPAPNAMHASPLVRNRLLSIPWITFHTLIFKKDPALFAANVLSTVLMMHCSLPIQTNLPTPPGRLKCRSAQRV